MLELKQAESMFSTDISGGRYLLLQSPHKIISFTTLNKHNDHTIYYL